MRLMYLVVSIAILAGMCASYAKPKTTSHTVSSFYASGVLRGAPQLTSEVNQIIAEDPTCEISVFVKSMKYGDALYALNTNRPLTPASTMKVLTAEAALVYLGSDYRFSTQVLTDAKNIQNGILQGNLYIVLSGDPTLTYYDLADLLVTLKTQQIKGISGNVYIDNTAFDQSFYGPGWEVKDKSYCWAAPISASIINRNCLPFRFTPSKVNGRFAQVITSPRYFYPPIKSSVITKAKGTRTCALHLSKSPNAMISFDGCIARGNDTGLSYVVSDVFEYNRALFTTLLKQINVTVYGKVTFGSAPQNVSLVAQHPSEPLKNLVYHMLKKSDNVIAGAIFKKIGQLYSRQPGSWENAGIAVSQILARNAKVNTSGLRILDGSGLSPNNLITSSQMMQVLDFAYHHNQTSFEFISSLPIAGVDGTLKARMAHIARRVCAKTGTISGVVSLAGYAMSADKEPLAFVIMINGSKANGWRYREIEDRIVTALTRYRRGI